LIVLAVLGMGLVLRGYLGKRDPGPSLPSKIAIEGPTEPVVRLEIVEDLTEAAADALLDLGDVLLKRDYTRAAAYLADDFAGHAVHQRRSLDDTGLDIDEERALHLHAVKQKYDVRRPTILGKQDFLESLERLLGPMARMRVALLKVKGAEFEKGAQPIWGKLKLKITLIGDLAGGGRAEVSGWAFGRVEKRAGRWLLHRFQIEEWERNFLEGEPFIEKSAVAGLQHFGPRFGSDENAEDAWQGIACHDVNGDGRWDLFMPGLDRNRLYLATESGVYSEEAEARGLAQPAGGTGSLLFDYDRDGDVDLFVTHRAYLDPRAPASAPWRGEAQHLYQNDGTGHFTDVSEQVGLGDQFAYGFSATAFDHDGDGWVDIFVCAYGRAATEHNDHWLEATNGQANRLFRNVNGERFEEVAGDLGIAGRSWTYASAAADFDGDGDTDLYVANDYGTNRLWRNDGEGGFEDAAGELGVTDIGNGMGVTWGDLNNDGTLDLYVANMSSTAGNRILDRMWDVLPEEERQKLRKSAAGNTIFLQGESGFTKQPKSAGGVGANWAWSASVVDFDLDANSDIFCVNGFVTGDLAHDT